MPTIEELDLVWSIAESSQEITVGGTTKKAIVDGIYTYSDKNYNAINVIIIKDSSIKEGDSIIYKTKTYTVYAFNDEFDDLTTQFLARSLRSAKK